MWVYLYCGFCRNLGFIFTFFARQAYKEFNERIDAALEMVKQGGEKK